MRATRIAITLFFFLDGLLLGSWAARVPAVQSHAGLTDPQLGLALFSAAVGALVAMPTAGWLTDRVGSRHVTVLGLLVGSSALVVTAIAGELVGVAAALFVFGAAFGAINVSANRQGLALEGTYGRPILSSFHAAFSSGALVGAALGAVVAASGIGPQTHFVAVWIAVGIGAFAGGRMLLPRDADGHRRPARTVVRLPRPLLVIGAAAFFTFLAEGAAADWSAVYLSNSLGSGTGVAALGYTAFSLAMVASRLVGDRANGWLGPVGLVRAGGLLAASGLALALASGSTMLGLTAFAAMGVGLGGVVPVLFRAADTTAGVTGGVGIAAVSTIGWLGFLAGPPAIGLTASTVGLRNALWIVVAATAALAALAPCVAPRTGTRPVGRVLGPTTAPVSATADGCRGTGF
jgi:predicted MFS family arabinose efflux permease